MPTIWPQALVPCAASRMLSHKILPPGRCQNPSSGRTDSRFLEQIVTGGHELEFMSSRHKFGGFREDIFVKQDLSHKMCPPGTTKCVFPRPLCSQIGWREDGFSKIKCDRKTWTGGRIQPHKIHPPGGQSSRKTYFMGEPQVRKISVLVAIKFHW